MTCRSKSTVFITMTYTVTKIGHTLLLSYTLSHFVGIKEHKNKL